MRKVLTCLVLAVVLGAGARVALAQTVQGQITGTVLDPSGAVIPNAKVVITNQGTGISQEQTTGADGIYRFPLVPLGTYSLTVTAAGFAKSVTDGVVVQASLIVPLNVKLQVGTQATTVEVSTQGPLVETATSDLTSTISTATIDDMPLITRNVYDLTFLAPQVSQGMDFRPATGGTRESGTQYMLNGADNNDNFSEGYNNITPPLESVREFTILTNSMSAQYGRAAGAVVSTSQKSGTNSFHGALYEFNRDKSLNASDFFSNRLVPPAPKPAYVRNNFGGEVDGPIKRDKSFFSFAIDRVTFDTASTDSYNVLTPNELAAVQAAIPSGSLASYYFTKYPQFTSTAPCPTEPTAYTGYYGCYTYIDPITDPTASYFGRFDQYFSAKDRLSVTANIYRETYTDKYGGGWPSANPINYIDWEHYHNLALVETHAFGANIFNEFTLSQNRHYSVDTEGGGKATDDEQIIDGDDVGYFPDAFGFGAYEGGLVEGFVQDRWQVQDNLGWIRGRHSFKLGGNWMHSILYRNWDLGNPGYHEFASITPAAPSTFVPTGDTLPTGVPVPSTYGTPACPELSPTVTGTTVTAWSCFNINAGEPVSLYNADGSISNPNNPVNYPDSNLLGAFPYYQELSIDPSTGARANAYRHYRMNDGSLFIQDDWKARKSLTFNLGLRWEHYGAPNEARGILAQFDNFNCLSTANTLPLATCLANVRTAPAATMWNSRYGDFAPRVGFAWDLFGDGKTALRGGFGISYDRIFDNVWSNGAWNPPFYALLDSDALGGDSIFYSNPPLVSPSYSPSNPIPRPGYRVSVRTMENDLKDASAQNYFLGAEHQFAQNFLLRVNWQASLGRHLPVLMNWNRYDGMGLNPTLSMVRPNALYSGFNYRSDNVTSNYNALVVEVQKRMGKGLQFQAGYTWSHLLDIGSDLFSGSTSQGSYSQPYYYDSNNLEKLEYGSGAFDHRHSIKLGLSYQLPGRNQKGALGHVIGGWQFTTFLQSYSGHPIEVYDGDPWYAALDTNGNLVLDANGNAINIGGDYLLNEVSDINIRPQYVGGKFSSAYSHANPADSVFTDVNPIGCGQTGLPAAVANVAACNASFGVTTPNSLFINPAGTGIRYPYLARNAFYGPWYTEMDSGLYKNIKITEGTKLQLRFEFFNLPNHPDFDYIDTNLADATTFGRSQGLANSPRRVQIGGRFIF